MTDLETVRRFVGLDHGLAVVSTTRPDGSIRAAVVNAGVMQHPRRDESVVAFVSAGSARRLRDLRARPRATLVFRAGWQWCAVDGDTELAGPDDALDGIDAERLRVLLREIFTAAGGSHDDWDEYDRVMAAERRVAVFVDPVRIYGNG